MNNNEASISTGRCPKCGNTVPCFCSTSANLSEPVITRLQPVLVSRDDEILAELKDIRKELKWINETLRVRARR